MIRVCAWCSRELIDNEGGTGEVIPKEMQKNATHGICKVCRDEMMKNMPSFGQYIKKKDDSK